MGGRALDITTILMRLSEGMLKSVLIFGLTLVFSLPLGLLVSFGRMSKWAPFVCFGGAKCKSSGKLSSFKPISLFIKGWISVLHGLSGFKPVQFVMKIFISILRGTPLMLQIMFVYYGPYFIFGIKNSSGYQIYAVIIAFAINYAAYFSEIYRSGIESMPKGQYEAAEVLGYSKAQTFFKIILPQMIKRILPPVTNEVITLVKDTSLAFVIAYTEMFTIAKNMASAERSVLPYVGAAIFYYVFNLIVAMAMEKAENRLAYYQ